MLIRHCAAERGWVDHFDVRSMPQNVHHDFLGMTVGNFQLNGAIGKGSHRLPGMPLLLSDPPGGLGIEHKRSRVLRRTGKDSITPQLRAGIPVYRRFVEDRYLADGVDRKPPSRIFFVTPSIQIPVPA